MGFDWECDDYGVYRRVQKKSTSDYLDTVLKRESIPLYQPPKEILIDPVVTPRFNLIKPVISTGIEPLRAIGRDTDFERRQQKLRDDEIAQQIYLQSRLNSFLDYGI